MQKNIHYKIEYHSINRYEEPVNEAFYKFLVTPENNEMQFIANAQTVVSFNETGFYTNNHYGFLEHKFYINKPLTVFEYKSIFNVTVKEILPQTVGMSNEEQWELLHQDSFKIDKALFLYQTNFTKLDEAFYDDFDAYQGLVNLFDYLCFLNQKLHEKINFITGVSNVETTANDTLKAGAGVCQDFAHVFIAVARKNHIPARYVSGYLNQGDQFLGAAMMHAWVECYVPDRGWVAFDPANNYLPDHHYIKVAHGKDYNDCSQLKGVIKTNGKNETEYHVKVQPQQ